MIETLARIDPFALTDSGRIDVIRCWERQSAWVAAMQADTVATQAAADDTGA